MLKLESTYFSCKPTSVYMARMTNMVLKWIFQLYFLFLEYL